MPSELLACGKGPSIREGDEIVFREIITVFLAPGVWVWTRHGCLGLTWYMAVCHMRGFGPLSPWKMWLE
jgi:hypothetical protein